MISYKDSHLLSVCCLTTFLGACSTSSNETSAALLENNINITRSTSSMKSSFLEPTVALVPNNTSLLSSYPSSSYLGSNIIAPLDILSIDVYKNSDLTSTIQVDSNGDITFPLLSKIHVQGMNPTQLAVIIKQGLEKDYIVEAHVNVLIKNTNENQFTIEGAVKRSGVYSVSGKTTLLQAIARAGGLSGDADEHHATLLRKTSSGEIVQDTIDVAAIRRGRLQDFLLLRGDRIVIQKAIYNRVTVSGAATKPGIFPLTEGITVLQAITLAGGFNSLAHKGHIILLRRNNTDKSFNKYSVNIDGIKSGFDIDPEVQADDRIIIIESKQRVLLDDVTRILAPLSSINTLTK